MLVHLHEMMINTNDEISKQEKANKEKANIQAQRKDSKTTTYSLGGQAWTALGVFLMGYCNTGVYQLPLFHGAPSKSILTALSQGECHSVIKDLMDSKSIQLVKGASVIVRIADGRRDEELQIFTNRDIDQSFLPVDELDAYMAEPKRDAISNLVLHGKAEESVKIQLAYRFKQLIYKSAASHSTDNFVASQMTTSKDSMDRNTIPVMRINKPTGQKQLAEAQGQNQHVTSPWNESAESHEAFATGRSVPEGSSHFQLPTAL
ncbi:uncharacterized protein LOC122812829 [Protopterus annectens]|uniref:uncharacterized protein LOC122812829 n=1 Tax=Protopterus annectens TaxID=7888 RepID=UPI001CFADEB1|nr:uncharacterized protein LOC122812829 [Protopterus annectens]